MQSDDMERLAVLETEMETMKAQHEIMIDKIDNLLEALAKQKGFIGGVVFVVSALATAVGIGISYFLGKPS